MTQLEASAYEDDGGPAELTISQPANGVCVLAVNCELDMVTIPTLRQRLTQELAAGHRVLVLDFTGCGFMGSSGLALLVEAREHTTRTATHLSLAGLNRIVARSLQTTGLDAMFDIHPSTDAAVAALRP